MHPPRRRLLATAGLAAALALATGATALQVSAAAPHRADAPHVQLDAAFTTAGHAGPIMCAPQFFHVTDSNGVDQVANADNFNGGDLCINNLDGNSDFWVSPGESSSSSSVQSFPNVSYGCGFPPSTFCTSGTPYPKLESSISALTLTWSTSHSGVDSGDEFDTGLDLFFQPSASDSSPSHEIMLEQNAQNSPAPGSAVTVTVNGHDYKRWTEAQSATVNGVVKHWTEVIYRRTPAITSNSGFALLPILSNDISAGLGLTGGQYLRYAGAGFEVWSGGGGLSEAGNLTLNNYVLAVS